MEPRSLATLVHAPDLDYVQRFQELAHINLVCEQEGTTVDRLTYKGILEIQVGDYADARRSLDRAVVLDGGCGEAHYQRGMAYALLACVKADAIPTGPGHQMPPEKLRFLLAEAAAAFAEAVRLNESDDEAQERLLRIGSILDTAGSEEQIGAMLRGEDVASPRELGDA